jgi:hypothetical protein
LAYKIQKKKNINSLVIKKKKKYILFYKIENYSHSIQLDRFLVFNYSKSIFVTNIQLLLLLSTTQNYLESIVNLVSRVNRSKHNEKQIKSFRL